MKIKICEKVSKSKEKWTIGNFVIIDIIGNENGNALKTPMYIELKN